MTGGCFDTDDFAITQNLTSDSKPDNAKIRGSDLAKKGQNVRKSDLNEGKEENKEANTSRLISKSVR